MIIPLSIEEIGEIIETDKVVLFFTADWCGDCVYIKPQLPAIEDAFPSHKFVEIDRDAYIELCQKWDIFGIPSFIVIEDGQERGRLVNKFRKTKEEVLTFLKETTTPNTAH